MHSWTESLHSGPSRVRRTHGTGVQGTPLVKSHVEIESNAFVRLPYGLASRSRRRTTWDARKTPLLLILVFRTAVHVNDGNKNFNRGRSGPCACVCEWVRVGACAVSSRVGCTSRWLTHGGSPVRQRSRAGERNAPRVHGAENGTRGRRGCVCYEKQSSLTIIKFGSCARTRKSQKSVRFSINSHLS